MTSSTPEGGAVGDGLSTACAWCGDRAVKRTSRDFPACEEHAARDARLETAVEDSRRRMEEVAADGLCGEERDDVVDAVERIVASREAIARAKITAPIERAILVVAEMLVEHMGHATYPTVADQPAECHDECPACAIEDELRAALPSAPGHYVPLAAARAELHPDAEVAAGTTEEDA